MFSCLKHVTIQQCEKCFINVIYILADIKHVMTNNNDFILLQKMKQILSLEQIEIYHYNLTMKLNEHGNACQKVRMKQNTVSVRSYASVLHLSSK